MRATIYIRISRDELGTGLGVLRQREDCEALALSRGWTVNRVSVETVKAGLWDLSSSHGRLVTRLLGAWPVMRANASERESVARTGKLCSEACGGDRPLMA
jgi:DNA invertase Pin-like site-specific DNA recombinase